MKTIKNTKNLITLFATGLIIFILGLSTAAEGHSHNWEMSQNLEEISLICGECDTTVLMYNESLLCEHEFQSFGSSTVEGEKCIHCGYTVQRTHHFSTSFNDGVHVVTCTDCNYTEEHPTTVVSDESSHKFICQVCDNEEMTVFHHTGINIFTRYYDDEYHMYECVDCGYSTLAPHTRLEIGFTDGAHVIECTDCDSQEFHSITYSVDENGHHTICTYCGKTETENHFFTQEILNENFHSYTCYECGYIYCEPHTDNCDCGFDGNCLHLNATITKIDDQSHRIECDDCKYEGTEEHYWEEVPSGETSFEYSVYCDSCHHTGTMLVEYGIILSNEKIDEEWILTMLTNGQIKQYKSSKELTPTGSFIKVKSIYGKVYRCRYLVEVEITDTLDNLDSLTENLYSVAKSNYRHKEITIDSITVSKVISSEDQITVEFKDGETAYFNSSELVVYDMTTSSMKGTINENDVIIYFTPGESDQATIAIAIG